MSRVIKDPYEETGGIYVFEPPKEALLDLSIPVKTRIKFPLIWEKLDEIGVRIVDLHEERYEEAITLIKDVYMYEEPLCCSLNIEEDEESYEAFVAEVRTYIHDSQSLVALKEDTNEVVAVLVTRVFDCLAMKTFARMSIYKGEAFIKIQRFRNHFFRFVDMKEIYGEEAFNFIHILCVKPEFRRIGIGGAIMNAAIAQTKLFNLVSICALNTTSELQSFALKKGFVKHLEMFYAQWKEDKKIVFEYPGENNLSAIFMGRGMVEEDEEPENGEGETNHGGEGREGGEEKEEEKAKEEEKGKKGN